MMNPIEQLLRIAEEMEVWKGKVDEMKSEVEGWDLNLAFLGDVGKEIKKLVLDCLDLVLLDVAGLVIFGKHIKEVKDVLKKVKINKSEKLLKLIEAMVEGMKASGGKSDMERAKEIADRIYELGKLWGKVK